MGNSSLNLGRIRYKDGKEKEKNMIEFFFSEINVSLTQQHLFFWRKSLVMNFVAY